MLALRIITGMSITSPCYRIRPRPPTGSDAPPANSAVSRNPLAARSGRPRDVLCFHALPAPDRLVGHLGAVLKVLEPVARYILVAHEDVLAFAFRSYKAVAEVGAVPLAPSLCHTIKPAFLALRGRELLERAAGARTTKTPSPLYYVHFAYKLFNVKGGFGVALAVSSVRLSPFGFLAS